MAVKRETDVLVIGAGPVGMFAALNLVERGLDVQIVDKDWRGSAHSYALALHPDSLRLLAGCGAAAALLEQAYKVEQIAVYRGDERVGALDFTSLGGSYPFLLIAPQSALEHALEQQLKERKVPVLWNHQALTVRQDGKGVAAKIGRMEKYSTGYPVARTEWMIAKEYETRAAFLVGADGYHSFVRKNLPVEYEHVGPAEAFSVYEFPSPIEFPHEGRVVFHDESTNVLWPLGRERLRWSFQVDEKQPAAPTPQALRELIRARAPWYRTQAGEITWHTTALFERRLVDRFGQERVWLAGDAAHTTGPVGGQSMNVGLREAHDLAERFSSILKSGGSFDLLAGYQSERRAEWSRLLGLGEAMQATSAAPGWARELAARILPCVPAAGEDLRTLLEQIGLTFA
jgi:2-polyprenyl-6-methoxyphenol hydroxylase-like FAD-dependent oxidoreductase